MGVYTRVIVLDIDECLIHTHHDSEGNLPHEDGERRVLKVDVSGSAHVAYLRPGVREFLKFCGRHFTDVVIWSAGRRDYVHAVVDKLYWGIRRPDIIMTRDDCEVTSNGMYYKPLSKVIDRMRHSNIKNMIIVDDRQNNFIANKGNGILVPPYEPDRTYKGLTGEDDVLYKIRDWLLKPTTHSEKDIRKVPKPLFYFD